MKRMTTSMLRGMSALGVMLLTALLVNMLALPVERSHAAPAPVENSVVQYDQTPGAVESPIAVTVNEQRVFVEKYKDVHYARFAFSGAVNVNVTPASEIASYTLSPRHYQIPSTQNGSTISFTLNEPRKLILQLGEEKLFLLADAPESDVPQPEGENVVDVTKYVNDTSGSQVQTANIQRAIDEAASVGGIVYFPNGTYLSGGLLVRSNVSLYLADGALLRGVSDAAAFGEGHFLLFQDVSNARVYGRGVIDVGGKELRNSAGDDGRVKIIRTIRASNITVQDVLLRDAGSWTVHIIGSNQVNITNLKIINDITNTNGDGIDPDSSQNVTIDGAFLYTTDDCFAIKTSGTFKVLQEVRDILVKNSVCHTQKSALKVGTETRANLTNITFENNAVVHADRVMSLYMSDGAVMQNIAYRNNSSEYVGGNSKQRLIDISITERDGVGDIRNVEISDHFAYQFSAKNSSIVGMSGHVVDVKFKNLIVADQVRTNAQDARITVKNAEVSFE